MSAAVCAFDSVDGCTKTVIADHPVGHPDRALRHRLRQDHRRDQQVQEDRATASRPPCSSNSMASKTSVVEQAEAVQAIAREHGGTDFVWATKPEERTPAVAGAPRRLLRLPADPARLARRVDRRVRADLAPRRVRARDHGGREELLRAGAAARPHRRRQFPPHAAGRPGEAGGDRDREARSTSAWSSARCGMEGTCTGEHGVGMGKMASMRLELGDDVIDVMRDIKQRASTPTT